VWSEKEEGQRESLSRGGGQRQKKNLALGRQAFQLLRLMSMKGGGALLREILGSFYPFT
jgi:hypothetical protein